MKVQDFKKLTAGLKKGRRVAVKKKTTKDGRTYYVVKNIRNNLLSRLWNRFILRYKTDKSVFPLIEKMDLDKDQKATICTSLEGRITLLTKNKAKAKKSAKAIQNLTNCLQALQPKALPTPPPSPSPTPPQSLSLKQEVERIEDSIRSLKLETEVQEEILGYVGEIYSNAFALSREIGTDSMDLRRDIEAGVRQELQEICEGCVEINRYAQSEKGKRAQKWQMKARILIGQKKTSTELTAFFDTYKKEINAPFYRDPLQGTLLHHLGKTEKKTECIEAIAKAGGDFAKQDNWGNTPLLWAIANANNGMAKALIKHGSKESLNLQDKHLHNNTPLHLAVGKGYKTEDSSGKKLTASNLQLVQALIAEGVDVNSKNKDGNTPLHLAYLRRDQEMIDALMEGDPKPNLMIENNQRQTPKQMKTLSYQEARKILSATSPFTLDKTAFPES